MATWSNQTLVFNYYFPDFRDVFAGSPISFVADGSSHQSTLSDLSPATFYVSSYRATCGADRLFLFQRRH
jgi:hypothetical protein